jgi:hypothetical protein
MVYCFKDKLDDQQAVFQRTKDDNRAKSESRSPT